MCIQELEWVFDSPVHMQHVYIFIYMYIYVFVHTYIHMHVTKDASGGQRRFKRALIKRRARRVKPGVRDSVLICEFEAHKKYVSS